MKNINLAINWLILINVHEILLKPGWSSLITRNYFLSLWAIIIFIFIFWRKHYNTTKECYTFTYSSFIKYLKDIFTII